ncbi:hypothetical protein [Variovorax sp. RCC_210]|uniref:hypothetical protein n=1 Tax=Variovorax sp. RCC_210 TaxID=3239217 RepID=UPI0035242370
MSHSRTARRPRRTSLNPISLARNNATRPTAVDLLQDAARSLREGVATEHEWSTVARAIVVAQSLERRGIVRGLGEHLHSAAIALQEIGRRAMDAGVWNATPLHLLELDVISTAIELHELQLQQIGAHVEVDQAQGAMA